jgi:hypothetical protein
VITCSTSKLVTNLAPARRAEATKINRMQAKATRLASQ